MVTVKLPIIYYLYIEIHSNIMSTTEKNSITGSQEDNAEKKILEQ